jgi:hypothetical protein
MDINIEPYKNLGKPTTRPVYSGSIHQLHKDLNEESSQVTV